MNIQMKLVILLLCMVQYVSSGRIYAQVTPNKYCGGANWQTNFDNPSSNHGIVPDQFQSPNVDTTIPSCISDCENTAGCNAALYRFAHGYVDSDIDTILDINQQYVPTPGAKDCIVCTSSPITWYTNYESGYMAREYYGYIAFPASNSGKKWYGGIWEDAALEVPVDYTILPCDDSGQMYERGPGLCKDGLICCDNGDVLECPSGAQRLNDTHCSSRKADVSNALHTAGLLSAPTSDTDAQANTCCSAGRYVLRGPNAVSCELCPAGTFNPGSSNALACTSCPAGTYQDSTGATSCIPWTGCDKGYFSVGGSATADRTTCSPCPSNTFQPSDNSRATQCTHWTTCSAGYYARIAATDVNDNTCSICGPNTYQPNVSFATRCDQCPLGTIAPLGASSCSSWEGKKFRPNTYQQVGYGADICHRRGGWYTTMTDYAENIWPGLGVRVTEDSCKTACNLNPQCTAFVHMDNYPGWADCYLCLGPYNGNGRDGYYFVANNAFGLPSKVYEITNRRGTTDWEDFSIATPSELQNFYNTLTIIEVTSGVPDLSVNETECQAYGESIGKWQRADSWNVLASGCFVNSAGNVYYNTDSNAVICSDPRYNYPCLERRYNCTERPVAETYSPESDTCTEGDYCFSDGTVLECPSGTVRLNATHCSNRKEDVRAAFQSSCPL